MLFTGFSAGCMVSGCLDYNEISDYSRDLGKFSDLYTVLKIVVVIDGGADSQQDSYLPK